MVEPVHPVVPLEDGYKDLCDIFDKTAVSSNAMSANAKFTRTLSDRLGLPDHSESPESGCSIVLGHVCLYWSTLHPSSRGLKGVLLDTKAASSFLHQTAENLTRTYVKAPSQCNSNKFSGFDKNSLYSCDTSRSNKSLSGKEQYAVDPLHRKSSYNASRKGINRYAIKPGTTFNSIRKTLLSSKQSQETCISEYSLEEDSTSYLLNASKKCLNYKSNGSQDTQELNRNVFDTLSYWGKFYLQKHWRNAWFVLLSTLSFLWRRCLSSMTWFLSFRMIKEFKAQQILRNLTRRSHCCFALLYFPASINFQLDSTYRQGNPNDSTDIDRQRLPGSSSNSFRFEKKKFRYLGATTLGSLYPCLSKTSNINTKQLNFPTKSLKERRSILSSTTSSRSTKDTQPKALRHVFMRHHPGRRTRLLLKKFGNPQSRKSSTSSKKNSYFANVNPRYFDMYSLKNTSENLPTSVSTDALLVNWRRSRKSSMSKHSTQYFFSSSGSRKCFTPRVVSSLKKSSEGLVPENDSLTVKSIETYTSAFITNRFKETSSCQPFGTLAAWEPRLLLYGGAIYDSLEGNRGSASDWLIDFPLYSIVDETLEVWNPSCLDSQTTSEWTNSNKTKHRRKMLRYKSQASRSTYTQDKLVVTDTDSSQDLATSKKNSQGYTALNDSSSYTLHHQNTFRLNSSIFAKKSQQTQNVPKTRPFEMLSESFHERKRRSSITHNFPMYVQGLGINWDKILKHNRADVLETKHRLNLFTSLNVPPARFGCSSVVHKGRLYIFGGAGISKWRQATLMNDLWVLSPITQETQRIFGPNSTLNDLMDSRLGEYVWSKVPLYTSLRPPPCAFHLASVNDGFMYVIISDCTVADFLEDSMIYSSDSPYRMSQVLDERLLLNAEYARAQRMVSQPDVLEHYRLAINHKKTPVNQIWRINLESPQPQWQPFYVTISKTMPMIVTGGIALTFYNDRLFVYGTFTGHSYVSIGVLDIHLRMWVTSVRLPGAPVWVTAVAIGKLWFALGAEVWGIFNLETFEWRYSNAPKGASIRYGSSSVWLPPYLPFPSTKNILSFCQGIDHLDPRDLNLLHRNNLSTQYFYSLIQKRRPMDHIHTILLLGGFDSKGELSNQVDQILVVLPDKLSMNCFHSAWKEANLFYASLFGVNALREKSGQDNHLRWIKRANQKRMKRMHQKDEIIMRLEKELHSIQNEYAKQNAGYEVIIQQMQYRYYSKKRQILQKLLDREYKIEQLKLRLRRKKLT